MPPLNPEQKIPNTHNYDGRQNDEWRVALRMGEITRESEATTLTVNNSVIGFHSCGGIIYPSRLDYADQDGVRSDLAHLAPGDRFEYSRDNFLTQVYLESFRMGSGYGNGIVTLKYLDSGKEIKVFAPKMNHNIGAIIGAFMIMTGDEAQQAADNGLLIHSHREKFPFKAGLSGKMLREYLGIEQGSGIDNVFFEVNRSEQVALDLVSRLMVRQQTERQWRPFSVMSR